jgi:protein SCO1/2
MKKCCALAVLLAVWLGSTPSMIAQTQAQTTVKKIFDEVGIDQKLNDNVPLDCVFNDENGKQVTLGEYFHQSKPVILSLVYYECPMLCTQILNGMATSLKNLEFSAGKEFTVLSISINPDEKPPLAKKKQKTYVAEYGRAGAENGWHFLTGDEPSIKKLADAVGFHYVYDPETKVYAHASGIMVATPEGKLARYFYGVEYEPRDLRFAIMEASKENIGSPVDKLLLLCYHYDPMTGKYGPVIQNVLRIGGALTILVVGGMIFLLIRRDRHKLREATNA